VDKAKKFQIQFQPTGKRVSVPAGMTLLEAAQNSGIELVSVCGGEGYCGQCQVLVLDGKVNELTTEERFVFSDDELQQGYRLACRTIPQGDIKVEIPDRSLITAPRLQTRSDFRKISVDPLVVAYPAKVKPPSLGDLRADLERVVDNLPDQIKDKQIFANTDVLSQLSPKMREENWQATVFIREREIVGVESPKKIPLGFAVDLGTTKIAAHLLNLKTGEDLAVKGVTNPQIGYGEDVISRLNYVVRHTDERNLLSEKVRQTLDEILGEMLKETGMTRTQVVEGCIVGNTAMIHLLLDLPVVQLAKAPYVTVTNRALEVQASKLGMKMAPGAYVYIPPNVGGFVGSDHVAMVLATDIYQSKHISLGIDIGTNTEISLHIPGRSYLTSASCASGPAFEGAHISAGMRAAAGAIEKVKITSSDVEIKTVDEKQAVGICGSGIVDAVAELYLNGLINYRGRFQRERERVRMEEGTPRFVLVPPDESGSEKEIAIEQEDVNEIQLAKGAIHAGISILLNIAGIQLGDVEEVIIAGAFGSFIKIESALAIGLFPLMPNAKYKQVGNAALLGAKWMLVSSEAREFANEIVDDIHYVELTTYPKFNRYFAMGMLFPKNEGAN